MKSATKFILPEHSKKNVGKETPPDLFIMDNLETLLAITVDNACGNTSGSIVERFIKPRASTIFERPVYSMDGPETSIAVSGPHEAFFNSALALWIGGKHFSVG